MDVDVARWLVSREATPWLDRLRQESDPTSLAVATRLRRDLAPELAAAVTTQVDLRRRGRRKLGPIADALFLTPDGLEQATRPDVARWRAGRFAAASAPVADLGCGIGVDALALARAGLDVTAVERDEATAVLAQANLSGFPLARVLLADAATVPLDPSSSVFADPARRTARGRTWDVADLSPAWDVVTGWLGSGRLLAAAKLGPGLAHRWIPEGSEAVWVSHHGDLVELSVWTGRDTTPGRRVALVVDRAGSIHTLDADQDRPAVGPVGDVIVEPDPAVIRSGAVAAAASRWGLHAVAEHIAYLTGDCPPLTGDSLAGPVEPFGTVFTVDDVLPWDERVLRAWVRQHRIGTLEIKCRGLDLDPARLRSALRPRGDGSATLIVTPTTDRAKVLVVRR